MSNLEHYWLRRLLFTDLLNALLSPKPIAVYARDQIEKIVRLDNF
jgi:hypothetical protein